MVLASPVTDSPDTNMADLSLTEQSHADSPSVSPVPSPGIELSEADEGPDALPGSRKSVSPATYFISQNSAQPYPRPRNSSPYSRYPHARSSSATISTSSTPMTRTKSLPSVGNRGKLSASPSHSPVRPSSPFNIPPAGRSSPRHSLDETRPQQFSTPSFMDIESIAEDAELDLTPRALPSDSTNNNLAPLPHANTIPRSNSGSRRRPASPLHSFTQAIYAPPPPLSNYSLYSTGASIASSPSTTPPPTAQASRFNESYPSSNMSSAPPSLSLSTSSVPSTPTSFRSRSPSISSLETIPDSPDAEEAAVEAFNVTKLRTVADVESGPDSDGEKRVRTSSGLEVKGALRDSKKKRWSVCGAERRGDFEMETIWED